MAILSIGTNAKLGARVASYSRPVGPTCPSDCPFLSGVMPDGTAVPKATLCYADKFQVRYPSVAKAWKSKAYGFALEQWKEWQAQFVREALKAEAKGVKAIRIHVGGDFLGADGAIDVTYVSALLGALRTLRAKGGKIACWFYTHAWRELTRHRKYFVRLGVFVFASVHSALQAEAARSTGWNLAIDPGLPISEIRPGFHEIFGIRSLQCPEQAKKGQVTCDTCGYCFRKNGNVSFFRH